MITIDSINIRNQKVLMRVDFNVPIEHEVIKDNFRIQAALPSIEHCLNNRASVILMSHLGRPKGKRNSELSLIPVGEYLSDYLQKPVKFSNSCISKDAIAVSKNLLPGEVHLLENLRFYPGETENDSGFSHQLAKHGTVYINDAFGTAHRAHASNVGVVKYFKTKGIGFLMKSEYDFLFNAIQNPVRPLVIILGGAKIGTKLKLIHRFLKEADDIIIGGAMAFTFLKAKGFEIGKSLFENDLMETAKDIMKKSKQLNVTIQLPEDFIVAKSLSITSEITEKILEDFNNDEIGFDIGTITLNKFLKVINKGRTVVWNGPMGVFEDPRFRQGTVGIADAVGKVNERGGLSIIGGGDTAAVIRDLNMMSSMSHISTGGGASLELLAGKKLPALSVLEGV